MSKGRLFFFFDVDISNESCYEGPSGGKKGNLTMKQPYENPFISVLSAPMTEQEHHADTKALEKS